MTGSLKAYIHIHTLRTRRLIDATGAIGTFESHKKGAVARRTAARSVDAWQLLAPPPGLGAAGTNKACPLSQERRYFP